ncbi:DoxX family protein [Nonomuraea sp. NN258]|uniref:DoxX family protein n=1 Tax=Nonomuraea antri TaxID=2730852 RepID=UPI001567F0D6|nr:DoxX family protein [Nonomuraea antri]NRQ40367.1 DoxX family protein [Nonomuraea antri]
MDVFWWVVQALLAVMFAMSGLVKVVQAKDKLAGRYPWTRDFSTPAVRLIGVLEVLGAIGLIAPAATGIAPMLTPLAAAGLAVMMALAGVMHVRRGEASGVVVTAVLFVLTALVAWARFGPYGW